MNISFINLTNIIFRIIHNISIPLHCQSFSITKSMEYFLELRETIVAIIDNAEKLEYVEELPIAFVQQTVSNNATSLRSF